MLTKNAFEIIVDATAVTVSKVNLKDITIQTELERFYSEGVFQERKRQAHKNGETVPKHALY